MNNLKKLFCGMLAVLLVVSLAACGGQSTATTAPETTAAPETTEAATEAATEASTEAESYYPVTVTTYDYEGNEITTTYEKAPERVICVYQGTIETMIALGLEDHVIASYGLDNPVKTEWEEGLSKMNYNEDVFAPDKETVTMLEPDLIFSWGSLFSEKNLGDQKEWIANGTNTYISSNTRRNGGNRTLENEYTDLLNIGKIFNCEDKAQAIVDEMKNEIADVLAKTAGQESPRVSVIEFLGDDISNYGAKQLGGDMVTSLGGTLADPDASQIGKEDLVALDPDVIFVVYMARTENVEAEMVSKVLDDPAFADLSAVQNGRVYTIMLGDMYAATVRCIDGIRTFAAGMYPDLAK
ncbi:MAG: ABC transporter substrate-binding protein [Candidatus Faecousia sp.]|nr:ABC transporter substrate-binding protein [Candidatus Faecousia sp.]